MEEVLYLLLFTLMTAIAEIVSRDPFLLRKRDRFRYKNKTNFDKLITLSV